MRERRSLGTVPARLFFSGGRAARDSPGRPFPPSCKCHRLPFQGAAGLRSASRPLAKPGRTRGCSARPGLGRDRGSFRGRSQSLIPGPGTRHSQGAEVRARIQAERNPRRCLLEAGERPRPCAQTTAATSPPVLWVGARASSRAPWRLPRGGLENRGVQGPARGRTVTRQGRGRH